MRPDERPLIFRFRKRHVKQLDRFFQGSMPKKG
jgi:hypothetical protein